MPSGRGFEWISLFQICSIWIITQMDRMVGDDIASGIRQVVRQLLNLASDPDSQPLMARQPGIWNLLVFYRVEFISGLVAYMSEEDEEVCLMAARAIEFLSTHPNNKEILANHTKLVEKMVCFSFCAGNLVEGVRRFFQRTCEGYLPQNPAECQGLPQGGGCCLCPGPSHQRCRRYEAERLDCQDIYFHSRSLR